MQSPRGPAPKPFFYNDQFTGLNGWSNTGRSFQGDTIFFTQGTDSTIYMTWNDGYGASTGGAAAGGCLANLGIATITTNLETATTKNCMTSFGAENQTNTGGWSDGYTWKSGGIMYIDDGVTAPGLYLNVFRQKAGPPWNRANASIMYSADGGSTWCNPAGACNTNGAAPAANTAEFSSLPTMNFVQYEKAGTGTLTVDCQNLNIYAFSTTGDFASTYLMRAARGSNLQLAANWQYYSGAINGDVCAAGNWSSSFGNATFISAIPPSTVYIPNYGYLLGTYTDAGMVFYRASTLSGTWTQVFIDSAAGNLYGSVAALLPTLSTDASGNIHLYVCFVGQYLFDDGQGNTLYSPAFRWMTINKP